MSEKSIVLHPTTRELSKGERQVRDNQDEEVKQLRHFFPKTKPKTVSFKVTLEANNFLEDNMILIYVRDALMVLRTIGITSNVSVSLIKEIIPEK